MATPLQFCWRFACPNCGEALTAVSPSTLCCQQENIDYLCTDGVWHLLTPARHAYFAQFIHEYEQVRQAEGRGSDDAAYYRQLPFAHATDPQAEMWQIRAQSYQTLVDKVVVKASSCMPDTALGAMKSNAGIPACDETGIGCGICDACFTEESSKRPLTILDLGAGNGWLSNQLAQQGHCVAAVDLTVNHFDGLGAHRHYETSFLSLRAEFERLPLLSQQADLIIFNASFHYATSYEKVLEEALRLLRPGGRVVVMDTAIYHDPSSGQKMVTERETAFQQQHGFPSNALPSRNYLSYQQIDALGDILGLSWDFFWPIPRWRWTVRRWRARLRRRREPAQFPLLVGRREMPSLPRDSIS